MIKIISSKGCGKTMELIYLAEQTQSYIVCHSLEECSRIAAIAKEAERIILFPISYDEYIQKKYFGKNIRGFLIDNVEELIQHMSTVPILGITMTI
jgi:hypothetical protein